MASQRSSGSAPRVAVQEEPEEDVFDPEALEHISERQDHLAHEVQVLHNVLPSSATPSPSAGKRIPGLKSPRRMSQNEEILLSGLGSSGNLSGTKEKFNSTSTLYVDSTVTSPNLEATLRCVALALQYIIKDGHEKPEPNLYAHKFDEKRFPLSDARIPLDYFSRIPDEESIHLFLHRLFHAAALSAECAIITLVYVNRVCVYTDLALHASNWKRVLLGAVLMASKVWDDQAVWNVDFCSILPRIQVDDMNELERTYLEMLDFNIDVDSSVYTKYYFELRGLAEKTNHSFPLLPLNKDQASKLEAFASKKHEFVEKNKMRNAKSLDATSFTARAVLS